MLSLPANQILPLPSFPSQKSPTHKPRPAFNYHSVFCGTAIKFAHPNLRRKRTPCYSNGNRTNCWTTAPRRCADFRDCGRSVKVRCGMSGREDDSYYMRRAVERAREAIGCTSPNPMVGCVIVKDGEIVGEGFHPKAGQPHAEVFALRNAGELAEGAIAYVSLEPCNHYGRTPPCSEALIKAKVSKVVVGMVDPNPIVASKGVEKLKAACIQVVVGVEDVRGNVAGLEELLKEGVQKIVVEMLPVWARSIECENPLTSITQGLGLKNFTSIVSGGSDLIERYF